MDKNEIYQMRILPPILWILYLISGDLQISIIYGFILNPLRKSILILLIMITIIKDREIFQYTSEIRSKKKEIISV
jgi:hypothetical protein